MIRSTSSPVPTGTVDLGDDHRIIGKVLRQPRARPARTKVRSAWPSPRRLGVPTAMKIASAPLMPSARLVVKASSSGLDVVVDQRLEPGLVDRHDPGVQAVDLALVLVDADHVMPEIGKACARHEPDITRTHHRNFHGYLPLTETVRSAPATLFARD